MTMLEDDEAVVQALRAGARGYVVKGAQQAEILDAIRSVHAGRAVIGAPVARQLAALVGAPAPADFPQLTGRERDVLDAIAAGASTAQIADRLGLSGKTVRNHVCSILTKLEVVDRTQAVIRLVPQGSGAESSGEGDADREGAGCSLPLRARSGSAARGARASVWALAPIVLASAVAHVYID